MEVAATVAQRQPTFSVELAEVGVRFEVPTGAFYMFFRIEGMTDSAATVRRLIDEAGVGFAPGSAFGADGEGFMRMCYLRDPAQLQEALTRFGQWLKTNQPD